MNNTLRTAAETAMWMAILTLISKLFGFIREMVMATFFGTSYITDSYVMAITIPSMIFVGFFSAINTAYMPLFSKATETQGKDVGDRLTSEIVVISFIIALLSGIVGILFSDQIVNIFASGFTGEKAELTSIFLKVTFSYTIFTSASSLLEAYLRYKGVFLFPIIAGYFENAVVICVIMISAYYNYYLLVFGWMLAYIIRTTIIWYLAKRKNFIFNFTPKLGISAKQILAVSFPVFVGTYINQINVFVDKTLASNLVVGSIAALNYGYLLVGIITGLTISIIIKIIYPKMNRAQSVQNYDHFSMMISSGFNLIFIIALPCSMGAMLYSRQIVQIVYERGAFDAASTALTTPAFFYYSAGILFLSLNSFIVQIYYSLHDMKTPVIYGVFGVIINIILNIILVRYMALSGLALSTTISSFFNVFLLYVVIIKKYPYLIIIESKAKLLKIIISCIFSIAFSGAVYYFLISMSSLPGILSLSASIFAAMILYLMMLYIFKIEELKHIKQIVAMVRPNIVR